MNTNFNTMFVLSGGKLKITKLDIKNNNKLQKDNNLFWSVNLAYYCQTLTMSFVKRQVVEFVFTMSHA